METWLNKPDTISEKMQEDIESSLKIFRALTTNPKLSKVFHQPVRVSPVEFVFIGVLVHVHKAKLSLTQLSNAIDAMRSDVRKAFSDIRTNTKVSKRLSSFITTKVPKAQYKGDGKGDQPALKAVPLLPKAPPKKRKREIESESESEEESSEEEALRKSKAKVKSKASTSAAGDTNGKTRASGSKPSAASASRTATNLKESPKPPPKSVKKPKVDPPVFAASSKPGRINTSASAGPSTSSSAIKKGHGVSSSVKGEPESPSIASGSAPRPGPASSKRAAEAKADQMRSVDTLKQSAVSLPRRLTLLLLTLNSISVTRELRSQHPRHSATRGAASATRHC